MTNWTLFVLSLGVLFFVIGDDAKAESFKSIGTSLICSSVFLSFMCICNVF